MSNAQNGKSRPQFSRAPLITSAAMLGGGFALALVGLAVGGGYLLWATRRWVREMEVAPSDLAKIKWDQARAAVSAGAEAWQNGPRADPASAS